MNYKKIARTADYYNYTHVSFDANGVPTWEAVLSWGPKGKPDNYFIPEDVVDKLYDYYSSCDIYKNEHQIRAYNTLAQKTGKKMIEMPYVMLVEYKSNAKTICNNCGRIICSTTNFTKDIHNPDGSEKWGNGELPPEKTLYIREYVSIPYHVHYCESCDRCHDLTHDVTKMKSVYINKYSGYHHNRYDGYDISWGIAIALGGTGTADCFADPDDYPDEEFNSRWEGNDPDFQLTKDDFRREILQNLDGADLDEIQNLELGEKYEHSEYWGYYIDIVFENVDGVIIVDFDSYAKYICEF